jgi:hypothetical protein
MRRVGELRTMAIASFVAALGMVLYGTAVLGLVFVASIALGVAITFFNVGYFTLMQRRTSLDMQGRVMSAAEAVVTLPYVLSFLVGAAVVSVVPFRTIYAVEAVGLVLGGLYLTVGTRIRPEPPSEEPLVVPAIDSLGRP